MNELEKDYAESNKQKTPVLYEADWFHFYDVSSSGRSTGEEARAAGAYDHGAEDWGVATSRLWRLSFG